MLPITVAILVVVLLGLFRWFIRIWRHHHRHKLPPNPRGLPIIGHLHLLGNLPHRTLHTLSQKYGPIMSIRLGNVPTIIVSSPQAAKQFLKTHDTVFASRPSLEASEYLSYGGTGMVSSKYGLYWRNLRKFCAVELFSSPKIDSFANMRREEVGLFVYKIKEAAVKGGIVDVSEVVGGVIEDMMFRMMFGRSRDERFDLKNNMKEVTDAGGAFNISDCLPFLTPLDLQGLTRRFKALRDVNDKILEMIISEHEEEASCGTKIFDMDFVHALLSLLNKSSNSIYTELSQMVNRRAIKGIILETIVAGIDTSITSIEWIMTELIRHPSAMKKLQEEIKEVVGVHKIIEETDLVKFKYLDMVIKETFRLHPTVPLLLPRESMEEIVIDNYYIPKKSRVLINTWAMGRDPDLWSENVDEFIPERFVDKSIDIYGREFELLPFGSGRRICPGMHLGLLNVRMVVAQMVHMFDWELPNGMSPSDLNMDEKFGLTLPRAQHLILIPVLRD